MKVFVLNPAEEDMSKMDASLQRFFTKHFIKLEPMPPRRHMRFGLPFYVEDVTHQARFVYQIEGELLYVLRCFATHKEYEKWYKSFR